MNKLHTLLFVSVISFSPLAFADHGDMMGNMSGMGGQCAGHGGFFRQADTNKDGSIDKDEARAMQDKLFDEIDKNHDGKISKDEMAEHRRSCMHSQGTMGFRGADKNHDGKLTKEEAQSMPNISKHFDEIDTDKDGTVDRDEVHNFMKDFHH